MKKITLLAVAVIVLTLFTACGKSSATDSPFVPLTGTPSGAEGRADGPSGIPTPTAAPTDTPTPTPTPTDTPTPTPDYRAMGYERSRLTGLWIPAEDVDKRPIAVMINNIEDAYPQSSISRASVVYECMEEFGITRLMCLYEWDAMDDDLLKRVGSVRSGRPYFAALTADFDMIYVHFGYSYSYAYPEGFDNIDGIYGKFGLQCFSRDNSLPSPHNVFVDLTELSGVLKERSSYRKTVKDPSAVPYIVNEEAVSLNGTAANRVTLNISNYARPYFVYDPETRLYTRYQYGSMHIDRANGKPFAFDNLIVMFVNEKTIEPASDFQSIDLDKKSSGAGYYINGGEYIRITWDRAKGYTTFYDPSGKQLEINPGKTYISVFPNKNTKGVVFE